jgi:hypothetical protein
VLRSLKTRFDHPSLRMSIRLITLPDFGALNIRNLKPLPVGLSFSGCSSGTSVDSDESLWLASLLLLDIGGTLITDNVCSSTSDLVGAGGIFELARRNGCGGLRSSNMDPVNRRITGGRG